MSKNKQTRMGRPPSISAKAFIGVRLPQDLADRLAAWAKAHNVSVSDAVREMVENGLKNGASKR